MLPRMGWPYSSTTSAPDFAPLHAACSSLSSLLWPTNSVHDLSLSECSIAMTNPKSNKIMWTTIGHQFLIWLTADRMASFMGKP
jgi:hypothetical protein